MSAPPSAQGGEGRRLEAREGARSAAGGAPAPSPVRPPGCLVAITRVELVTLGGLAAACAGTLAAARLQLTLATGLMTVALFADMLDGWLARRATGGTAFGRQLDSGVDVFIYLVLPAAILYQLGLRDPLSLVVLLAVTTAGVLRLAHFTVTGFTATDDGPAYGGMPVFWLHLVVALALPAWALLGPVAALPLRAALAVAAGLMLWDRPFPKPRASLPLAALILAVAAAYLGLAAVGIAAP